MLLDLQAYIKRKRCVEHIVRMGEMRDSHTIVDRKSEGKRPFGNPGHRWEDDIKM
jgi:hypothetical protein